MTTDADRWFEQSAARLNDPQDQRVWSVIVSAFGDLAQRPGDRISGGALTRIIAPLGIKSDAMRVALHRLRKDGWIESARSGRTSEHHLTPFGRAQSAEVTPRIYDRAPDIPPDWHLLIARDGTAAETLDDVLMTRSYINVGRHTALGHGPVPADCEDLLAVSVKEFSVPGWLKAQTFPDDLNENCARFLADLGAIDTPPETLTALQIATLRTVIVHRWRRVVLRHLDLPESFYPEDWTGPACRAAVFSLLDDLPRPKLSDVESECHA